MQTFSTPRAWASRHTSTRDNYLQDASVNASGRCVIRIAEGTYILVRKHYLLASKRLYSCKTVDNQTNSYLYQD
jgi:hypothetical protein